MGKKYDAEFYMMNHEGASQECKKGENKSEVYIGEEIIVVKSSHSGNIVSLIDGEKMQRLVDGETHYERSAFGIAPLEISVKELGFFTYAVYRTTGFLK